MGATAFDRHGVDLGRATPWWGWSVALAAVALAPQLAALAGAFEHGVAARVGPMVVTAVVAVVWLLVAVGLRVERPVITLAVAGAIHGGFTAALGATPTSLVASSDLGIAHPTGTLAIVATNVAFGALLGVAALVITRNRPAPARA